MFPLLGGDGARQLHVDRRIEIAGLAALADRGHAVSFQPEDLPVLRRRRNPEPQRLAAERRDVDLAAEHGGGQGNRHARVQIASLSLERRMRRDPDPEIEIAGLRAAAAVLALARDAHPRAFADARRDSHVDGPRVAVVLDREAAHRAVIRVFETELDLLLDVAALARAAPAAAARPAAWLFAAAAAEERVEEIG